MELFLQEIENALKARLYYLAVVTAVTIPDVCAALASPDGESTGAKYKAWYSDNVGKTLTWFTEVDCYKFRCGGVHQGRFGHKDMQYDRTIFLLPGPVTMMQGLSKGNGGSAESAYMYSAVEFCQVFVKAARDWLKANADNATVKANMAHLVELRPEGLSPHIVGIPVIA